LISSRQTRLESFYDTTQRYGTGTGSDDDESFYDSHNEIPTFEVIILLDEILVYTSEERRYIYIPKNRTMDPKTPKVNPRKRKAPAWTDEEVVKLLNAVNNHRNQHPPITMSRHPITMYQIWDAVAKVVGGGRDATACKKKWRHLQEQTHLWTDEEEQKLVGAVKSLGETEWKKVSEKVGSRKASAACIAKWYTIQNVAKWKRTAAVESAATSQPFAAVTKLAVLNTAANELDQENSHGQDADVGAASGTRWRRVIATSETANEVRSSAPSAQTPRMVGDYSIHYVTIHESGSLGLSIICSKPPPDLCLTFEYQDKADAKCCAVDHILDPSIAGNAGVQVGDWFLDADSKEAIPDLETYSSIIKAAQQATRPLTFCLARQSKTELVNESKKKTPPSTADLLVPSSKDEASSGMKLVSTTTALKQDRTSPKPPLTVMNTHPAVVTELTILKTADNKLKQDNSHGQDAAVGATTQPAYEKLEQEIESPEADAATKIAGYEQDIASLKAAATVAGIKVTSYEQEIVSLKAAATVADNKLTGSEQKITSLEAAATVADNKVTGYEQEIASLKAAATVADTNDTSYEQEIVSLKAAATVAGTKVTSYEAEIVSLKAAATVADNKFTRYERKIASLKAAAIVADNKVEKSEQQIASLKAAATADSKVADTKNTGIEQWIASFKAVSKKRTLPETDEQPLKTRRLL
jgi:uncharacterized coiled-coil DUF342 family protein